MAFYNPCNLVTIFDFIFYFLVLLLYIEWGKAKNLITDLVLMGTSVIIYSIFRKQLHTSFGISTDVDMFGRPMPKYCK